MNDILKCLFDITPEDEWLFGLRVLVSLEVDNGSWRRGRRGVEVVLVDSAYCLEAVGVVLHGFVLWFLAVFSLVKQEGSVSVKSDCEGGKE
jgi:hypothetical protein